MLRSILAGSAAFLLAACGKGPSSPSNLATSEFPPIRFTVMTFNIQHGIDGNGRYGLQRAIETIARLLPDIVGLQEVTRKSSGVQL